MVLQEVLCCCFLQLGRAGEGNEAAVDGAYQIDVLNTHILGNTGCMTGLFKPGKVTLFSSHCAGKKNFYHPHNKLKAILVL